MIYDLAAALLRPRQSLAASYRDYELRKKGRIIVALFLFAMAFCAITTLSGLIALNAAQKVNSGAMSLTEAKLLVVGIYLLGYSGLAVTAYSFLLSVLYLLLAIRDIFRADD